MNEDYALPGLIECLFWKINRVRLLHRGKEKNHEASEKNGLDVAPPSAVKDAASPKNSSFRYIENGRVGGLAPL